ncbi:uncharacterized protein KGF55_003545 [Candida pseudojiufengensis]|uniref:uncharacterized protein n=1 Tax=Candida pseudojiufengensis TaxID=497109 RepID=UPI0022242F60|nr:uncharacterized protein KGF55_003545 [Candida pseudojiufengensis]KAI5962469.1 hypothetical protein KGF55_003545 [Candida pseudojiufengensis]
MEPPAKKQRLCRTVSTLAIANKLHPLNVKPSGNQLLADDVDLQEQRKKLLGLFSILPNELILKIISYMDDIQSLINLSQTSRIFYALLYDEEKWKQIYINQSEKFDNLSWLGSWKQTVTRIKELANPKLPNNLLCCDEIYRPYQCSQIDYANIFKNVIAEEEISQKNPSPEVLNGRIPRFDEQTFDIEEFENFVDSPFILTNKDPERWPKWTFESLLTRFPNVKFRQESCLWDLSKYSQYLKSNQDECPLYLFDCNSEAMKTLRKEYNPPSIFNDDIFKLFQNYRPDHAWLIMGSKRSGSTFHKDPNSTSAWNVSIQGRKLWIMLPPNITPPGVSTDEEESEVTSPISIAEWVISGFYNDSTKLKDIKIGITFPGECMFVPSGWWHSVINIDDSIAITQNFVPSMKLFQVLNFLKNKPGQISGFKLGDVQNLIKQLGLNIDLNYNVDLNEDCGELTLNLPIFEILSKLLIDNGQKSLLEDALLKVEKLEAKQYCNDTGKSKKWENLTENTGFSFGFEID